MLRSFVREPLEPCVVEFVEDLFRQGYSRSGAEQHVCFIAHLDRWLNAEGLGLRDLSESVIGRYLAQRRAADYVQYLSAKAMRPLLDHLAPLGLLPAAEPVVLGPVEELLSRYRGYLLVERGLTVGTARGYADCVRPFVQTRLQDGVLDWAGLSAGDVTGFVLVACPGRAVGSAKLIVCSLRSLLGWLHLTGVTPTPLRASVPAVAGWSLSGLPKGLDPGQLRKLLAACDRRTPTGRRDYAILLLLARLGLRAGEVARLELGDIDWRRGEFVVRGKGNRAERLPLPADVGAAITAYLRRGRPDTAQGRSVFVRGACTTSGADHGRDNDGRLRRCGACWSGQDPYSPAATHGGDCDAAGGQPAGRGRSGVAASLSVEHRYLRQRKSTATRSRHWPGLRPSPLMAVCRDRASGQGSGRLSGALRRALDYRLVRPEKLLGQFLEYLQDAGVEHVTVGAALDWAQLPAGGQGSSWSAYRLSVVRGFATYLQGLDPDHEVPATDLLPQRPQRAVPYLYS